MSLKLWTFKSSGDKISKRAWLQFPKKICKTKWISWSMLWFTTYIMILCSIDKSTLSQCHSSTSQSRWLSSWLKKCKNNSKRKSRLSNLRHLSRYLETSTGNTLICCICSKKCQRKTSKTNRTQSSLEIRDFSSWEITWIEVNNPARSSASSSPLKWDSHNK